MVRRVNYISTQFQGVVLQWLVSHAVKAKERTKVEEYSAFRRRNGNLTLLFYVAFNINRVRSSCCSRAADAAGH